jgi:hypothetical protein
MADSEDITSLMSALLALFDLPMPAPPERLRDSGRSWQRREEELSSRAATVVGTVKAWQNAPDMPLRVVAEALLLRAAKPLPYQPERRD